MKILLVSLAVVLGLGGLFLAQSDQPNQNAKPAENRSTIQSIQSDVLSGGRLIDVRTKAEFTQGHIDGAINLTLQDIQAGVQPKVEKDKPIYVYCRTGSRSAQAMSILKEAGYHNIVDLGAINNVQAIGGVVKT